MRLLKFILTFAVIFVVMACQKESAETGGEETDLVLNASISSDDPSFSADEGGGTVSFGAEGGKIVINVDCEVGWTAENHATDILDVTWNFKSGTLTISMGQNTVEEERTGTVSLLATDSHTQFATVTVIQSAYDAPMLSVETESWNAPARGALSTSIAVESSAEWEAECPESWLTLEKVNGEIRLTASENEETESRSADVSLVCTDGIRSANAVIAVVQDGSAYISTGTESLRMDYIEGTSSVTVKSNFDWDFSCEDTAGWMTLSRDGDVLVVSVSVNDSEDSREGTVILTAGDGAENVAEVSLSVIQSGVQKDLYLVYTINSGGTEITLPLDGTVDCTVDWGDGSSESIAFSFPTHTYSAAGEYGVSVSGTVTALNSYRISSSVSALLTEIRRWGLTGLTSMEYAFYMCKSLTAVPTDYSYAFNDVTTFAYAFAYTGLTSIPADLFANCSEVTSFEGTFYHCSSSSFTSIPAGLFSHCTKATTFDSTFYYCLYIRSVPSDLFANCSEALTFYETFAYCWGLTTLPAGLFSDCAKATAFRRTFYYCSGLESVSEDLFKGCTSVTTFYAVFCYCTGLLSVPEGLFSYCPEVTSFEWAFGRCSSLRTVPENLFAGNPKVRIFNIVFWFCSNLRSVPAGLFANNLNVVNFNWAFYNDQYLTGESPYNLVNGVKVHLYERSSYTEELNCVAPTSYEHCYYNCIVLDDYNDIPEEWR